MGAINFFDSVDHLEPKCPGCNAKIDWGITTEYDDKNDCHVCLNCGAVLK